jgi:hypothetical protein
MKLKSGDVHATCKGPKQYIYNKITFGVFAMMNTVHHGDIQFVEFEKRDGFDIVELTRH